MPPEPTKKPLEYLDFSGTVEDFDRAGLQSLREFDRLTEQTITKYGVRLACRSGCSLCCSLRVDAYAHEVFMVAHHIWSHFSQDEVTQLRVRLRAHSAKVRPMTPFEHATTNIQCPLLRNDRCSVYASRPRACRRHHSTDLPTCQFTYNHPTNLEHPAAHDLALFRELTAAMEEGIAAYSRSGYDCTIYELGSALEEALGDPQCWQRWRNREQAFLKASVTPLL